MKTRYSTALLAALLLTAPAVAEEPSRTAPQSMSAVRLSYANVVEQARAAVPLVEAKGVDVKSGLSRPAMIGTGVILRPDGFMVTDAALAEFGSQKGGSLTVKFEDGSAETAAVAMVDRRSGLAVLKLPPRQAGYPAVGIAGPNAVMSGDLYVGLGRKDAHKVELTQGIFAEAPDPAPAPTSEWVDPDKASAPAFDTGHDWRDSEIGTPLFGMDGKLSAVIARPENAGGPVALPGAAARLLVAIVTGEMPQDDSEGQASPAASSKPRPRYDSGYDGYGLPDWEPVRTHSVYTFSYWSGWGSPYWWDGYWGYAPVGWYWTGLYAPPPPIFIIRSRPHHNRHWYRDHHGSWDGRNGGWHNRDGRWDRDRNRGDRWDNDRNHRDRDRDGRRESGWTGDRKGGDRDRSTQTTPVRGSTTASPATPAPRIFSPKAPSKPVEVSRPRSGRDFERSRAPVSEPVITRGTEVPNSPAAPSAPRLFQQGDQAPDAAGGNPNVDPRNNVGFGNWRNQAPQEQEPQTSRLRVRPFEQPDNDRDRGAKAKPPRNDPPREDRGRDKPKSKRD